MIFFVTHTYTSAITASVVRKVKCEKCGCAFAYEMIRRGEGVAESAYASNEKSADHHASERARKSLQRRLRRGVDPVACPDCGWYQTEMVQELRRRELRPLLWVGILVPILALVVIAMALLTAGGISRMDHGDWHILACVTWVAIAASGASLGTRYWVQCRLNPNRDYPMRPQPYPGAPTAWKIGASACADARSAPQTSEVNQPGSSVLGYEGARPEMRPGGWVVVQLARVRFPEICCRCLTNTQNVYQLSRRVNTPLRLCEACARRERRQTHVCVAAGFIPVWLLIAVGVLSSRRLTLMETAKAVLYIGPIVAGLFGMVTGAIGSRMFPGAVQFRRFSPERNTIEIRFRNRGYADLFLEAQRDTGMHVVSSQGPPTSRLSA